MSQCEILPSPHPPLNLRLEGLKLGQRALYNCPLGYMLQGSENATCLASGNWSSPTPTCIPIQCPPLFLDDPHLSLVELNTSAWGRAVFRCAWGYRLSGASSIECEPSGRWSGAVPRCRGKFFINHIFYHLKFIQKIHQLGPHLIKFILISCSYSMYTTISSIKWSY